MAKFNYFLGIDNGCEGALSIIDDRMKIKDVIKYPRENLKIMDDFLIPYKNFIRLAILERPFMGGKKNKGNEITYQVFGTHLMNLASLEIPFELAEPRTNMKTCWRKEFNFKSKERKDLKEESIEMVKLLFEDSDKWIRRLKKNVKTKEEYCKPDDNICEALLLSEYGRRSYVDKL